MIWFVKNKIFYMPQYITRNTIKRKNGKVYLSFSLRDVLEVFSVTSLAPTHCKHYILFFFLYEQNMPRVFFSVVVIDEKQYRRWNKTIVRIRQENFRFIKQICSGVNGSNIVYVYSRYLVTLNISTGSCSVIYESLGHRPRDKT